MFSALIKYLKQSANLKDTRTLAVLAGTIFILLALPLTVFTTLQTREPTGRAQSPNTFKWTPFMRGSDQFITGIAVNPNDSNEAYVSVDVASPRRTIDGGDNWYIPGNGDFQPFPNAFTSWSILVSQHSTLGKIILTGGRKGEIWRSTDGDSWENVLSPRGMVVDTVVVDPNNEDIFYAATGDKHDFAWEYGRPPTSGSVKIHKSTNSGSDWQMIYSNSIKETDAGYDPIHMIPSGRSIFSIEVKPGDSNVIFAATEKGLYKSSDGGSSYTRITVDAADPEFFASDTQIDPDNPEKMWVTLKMKGVYFSDDGGSSWQQINHDLPFNNASFFGYDRLLLAKHSDNSRKLYLANGAQKKAAAGLWVSNDLGVDSMITSWSKVTRWPDEDNPNIEDNWSNKRSILYVAIPEFDNPDRIWIAGHGGVIYKSDNKGQTWEYMSADEKILDSDLGDNLTFLSNNGLAMEGLTWVDVDPHDQSRLYGGDIDHGIFVSVDGGESARLLWRPKFGDTGTGPSPLIVDPDVALKNRMYVGLYQQVNDNPYKGGVAYSEDHGKNWVTIGGGQTSLNGLPLGNVLGLQMDLSSVPGKRVLVAALDGVGIYRGRQDPNNTGRTLEWSWEPFGLNAPDLAQCSETAPANCAPGFSDLKVDPVNPKRMYAVGPGSENRGYPVDTANTGIYRCNDITAASCNWERVDNTDVNNSIPDEIVFDAKDSKIVYSLGENGVYLTEDVDADPVVWQSLLDSASNTVGKDNPSGVSIVENGASVLYVGCRGCGVMKSVNQEPFTEFNEVEFQDPARHTHNLKYLKVRGVDYDPVTNRLFVSTQGYGSFVLQLPDDQIPQVNITNPNNGQTVSGTVDLSASASDNVGVTKVGFFVDGTLKSTDTSSPYAYSWNTMSVSNGDHTLLAKAYDAVGNIGISSIVSVTVSNQGTPAAPTVDIKAGGSNGPITIVYNQKATLSWSSTNSTSCTASGAWSGGKYTSGSQSTGRLTSSKTYTLTCTGVGGTKSDSVVVKVAKKGDLNKDGKIDIFDLSILLSRWNKAGTAADINASGKVDIFDLSILLSRWGK